MNMGILPEIRKILFVFHKEGFVVIKIQALLQFVAQAFHATKKVMKNYFVA